MAIKQIYKRVKRGLNINKSVSVVKKTTPSFVAEKAKPTTKRSSKKNKEEKQDEDMKTEQFDRAEALAQDINVPADIKVLKKDKGLIERTESSKIILTEDNRQVLTD